MTALFSRSRSGRTSALLVVLAILATACSPQGSEFSANDQVPASQRVEEVAEEEGEGGEEAEGGAEVPEGAALFETGSSALEYTAAPSEVPAGEVTIALDNATGTEHNVLIEGFEGDRVIVAAANGVDVATIELAAGTYTYYCSIAGHRAAGMEGSLTAA